MDLQRLKYVFLLGAGGIGMSALARYFLQSGIQVGGYDKTRTSLTDALIQEGVDLVFEDSLATLPSQLKENSRKDEVLIIYTPAIPKDHQQFNFLLSTGWKLHKRAEVLGIISKYHTTIAVAGTHGKTTTSTLIAHILESAGLKPVAFLGGISGNYNTNYLSGTSTSILVVEADEYDRSFLQLFPNTAVITSTDADHLDIYGKKEALQDSFAEFAGHTDSNGTILIKAGLSFQADILERALTYHTQLNANFKLGECALEGDFYRFSVDLNGVQAGDFVLGLPGFHNVENALAAIAAAYLNGVSIAQIREALASFKGVKRRFEYIIRRRDLIFIDDYAHHPEELRACISSVRLLYPTKKILGVFQPHLFSRTRDFYDEFAASLSLLDEVILLDIYPARELPIEGVSSAQLLNKITIASKQLVSREELPELVASKNPEVLLTLGAGDIDSLIEPLRICLTNPLTAA
jgi:UDP-N-acetylmuramate--alanine ligase